MAEQRGQATVELMAAIPLLLVAGAIALQLLLVGYTLTLADGAAEAGGLALAAGRPAKSAAQRSLPSWAEGRAEIAVRGGAVTVRLVPPSLAVTSSSYARTAGR
jgi:Flp pilus assembly protein TadG